MQTTKRKSIDESKLVYKRLKLGDVVTWRSQANGYWAEKTGTIIAVMNPGTSYSNFANFPLRFFEDIYRRVGFTRDQARAFAKECMEGKRSCLPTISAYYTLKFDPYVGMTRNEYHYLVNVDGDIYHPLTKYLKPRKSNN